MDGLLVKVIIQPPPPPGYPVPQGNGWQERKTVEGAHWYEYFSRHHLIFLEYLQLLLFPNMYWGRIEFFKNKVPASFGHVIASRFYSWYCYHCCHLHHRFTHHKILLADGSTLLHCHHDSVRAPVPDLPYDPNADAYAPPFFYYAYLAEPVPGEGDHLIKFLVKPCHECGTNHWHAIQGHAWDSQGQSQLFCYSQPLNLPVTVAASYRPHDTDYQILDGGPGGLALDSEDEGGNDVNANDQPEDGNAAVVGNNQPAGDNAAVNGNDQPAGDNAAVVADGQPADDNAHVYVFCNGHL